MKEATADPVIRWLCRLGRLTRAGFFVVAAYNVVTFATETGWPRWGALALAVYFAYPRDWSWTEEDA